jgi:hypothetical protein
MAKEQPVVQATKSFATSIGGPTRIIHSKQLFHADHPIVRGNPTRFKPVEAEGVTATPEPAAQAPAPEPAPATPATPPAPTADATDAGSAPTGGSDAQDGGTPAVSGDTGGQAEPAPAPPDPATATADELVAGYSRTELNQLATDAGVADADTLANKPAVAAAIVAARG